MTGYRTALGRARGLGSAKTGVGHFIGQRVSAVALLILIVWGVRAAMTLARGDYELTGAWLRAPLNLSLMCLLALAAFYHMHVGMRVIIEDYIHKTPSKFALLIGNFLLCFGGAAVTIVSLLKVALATGAT
ncbi:MAG TPA: succinate dehydrogenase, hydrophobic membrane anchor protein [Caulobacteraceae bacterium]|nr:succinate dehydrogenase, hydrophobic membrane anchor protein [Caulobacteraceae bacterium]